MYVFIVTILSINCNCLLWLFLFLQNAFFLVDIVVFTNPVIIEKLGKSS